MTPEREARFRKVAACRQPNLTIVLENVHDPHNIGAVLRSCDSVGIQEIFVVYTEPQLNLDTLSLGTEAAHPGPPSGSMYIITGTWTLVFNMFGNIMNGCLPLTWGSNPFPFTTST